MQLIKLFIYLIQKIEHNKMETISEIRERIYLERNRIVPCYGCSVGLCYDEMETHKINGADEYICERCLDDYCWECETWSEDCKGTENCKTFENAAT